MRTKFIYSLFGTLILSACPLCLPALALESELSEDNNTSNNQTELAQQQISPYLRPFLKPVEPTVPTDTVVPDLAEYRLGPGDVININLFNVNDQGGQFPVFMDGTVSIPLIGSFKVEGLTIRQVNELFLAEYGRYLKRPIVTVTLVSQRPIKLAIAGEINTPGDYTLPGDPKNQPKITDLLDKAGGLTVSADISKIKLRRTENGVENIYVLNFWDLLKEGDLSKNVPLADGDVVIIPKKEKVDSLETRQLTDATFGIKYQEPPTVTLTGEINRPGSYTVPIDGGEPRLSAAIRKGGGIKELADIRNIQVRRTTRDGEEQNIDVDLWDMLLTGDIKEDILLQNGDKIIIPTAQKIDPTEAQTLAAANFSPDTIQVSIIGPVRGQGTKKLPPNTTLNEAIYSSGGFDRRRANQETVELIRMNPNGTVVKRAIQVDLASGINEETNPILKDKDVIIVSRNGLTTFTDTIETVLGPIGRTFSFLNFFRSFDNLFNSF